MVNAEAAPAGAAEPTSPTSPASKAAVRTGVLGRVDWAAWRESARIVVTTRLAFFALAYAATWILADTQGRSAVGFIQTWTQWDAVHFVGIAENGYFGDPSLPNEIAFFPLFPLLLRALSGIGFAPALAGMFISLVASIVAGYFLYRLAETDLGEGGGRRAVTYLFLLPTAVFLIAPYSEALFLAGAIVAFYLARSDRWHLVGIPAAVAMGARSAGVFLLLGLLVEFLRQKDFSLQKVANGALALALGALPLLGYGVYLARTTGSAWGSYLEAQRAGWYRDFTNPIESFKATWNTWHGDYATNWIFAWRLEVLAAVVGVFFLGWVLYKREWGYATYMGATLAALMTSTWYFSIPRILLSLFPMVLLLAGWSLADVRRHENIILVLAPLAALGVVAYTQGIWFF